MWGSLASDYERGARVKCGLHLREGLRRYERLEPPLYTPTTKAETGHDQDVTPGEMAAHMEKKLAAEGITVTGERLAGQVEETSRRLYQRGSELAARAGLIMVDTKYEFGVDENGEVILIDEVHTPDSSRFWLAESYERRFDAGEEPENYDKEFLRLDYAAQGYRGDGEHGEDQRQGGYRQGNHH